MCSQLYGGPEICCHTNQVSYVTGAPGMLICVCPSVCLFYLKCSRALSLFIFLTFRMMRDVHMAPVAV